MAVGQIAEYEGERLGCDAASQDCPRRLIVSLLEYSSIRYLNMKMTQQTGAVMFSRGVRRSFHLTRGSNRYYCPSTSTLGSDRFHLLHDLHAFCHLAKHNVFTVQPRGENGRNEELRSYELDQ